MRLGKLGEQYVLKSERAFLALQFQTYEQASHSEYYVKRKLRDEEARAAYQKELEQEEFDGLYIRDLMREGVTADDERLRF
jgi:hypothetical protein